MSGFLRKNDFELLFKGPYRRIQKRRDFAVGKWKAKSTDDRSDAIIGFAKFSRPETRPLPITELFILTPIGMVHLMRSAV
jgi:hypothetical protein